MTEQPNVVLIHGAFADGSSWSAVVEALQSKGYDVTAPQFPLFGQVMSALGADTANVVGLVYIAGFGLDEGESIAALGGDAPPAPALANLIVDEQGFGRLPEDDFVSHFAADVDPDNAKVMHAAQQPVSMSVFDDIMGTPAWRSLPSWYLVAANDEAIVPDAERMFAERMGAETVEVPSSHVAMVSHPDAVLELIEAAARATASARA